MGQMMNVNSSAISASELNQLPLMSHLTLSHIDRIKNSMKRLVLSEGEHLFEQGQPADRFFLVRSGQVKLYRVSVEGTERVIDVKQPGQLFAETVLMLDECVYPLSANALTNTELLTFDFRTFKSILEESKETCFQLMADMSRSLQHYLDQVDYLTLQNASYRLVSYLLKQVPSDHVLDKSYEINLSTSKSIIASCLSIQPETFSRILRSLKNSGLIKVNGKKITILNLSQLKEMTA